MNRLRRLWARHPILTAVFMVSLLATLLFGIRTVMFAMDWDGPKHTQQPVAGWMTPRYVAVSWDIPKPEMFDIMSRVTGMERLPDKPKPIDHIAKDLGIPEDELIARLQAEVTAYAAEGHHD